MKKPNIKSAMTNTKTIIVFIFLVGVIALTSAFKSNTKEKSALVDITIPMWEMGKNHTMEVAATMPEDQYGYKPSEVSKTFGQQMVVHIGYSLSYFSLGMMKDEQVTYDEPDASSLTKREIIALIEKGFDDMTGSLGELNPEDLEVQLPFGKNKKITRGQAIIFAHDHVTNHRAKANLYIRMNNIEPPAYQFM